MHLSARKEMCVKINRVRVLALNILYEYRVVYPITITLSQQDKQDWTAQTTSQDAQPKTGPRRRQPAKVPRPGHPRPRSKHPTPRTHEGSILPPDTHALNATRRRVRDGHVRALTPRPRPCHALSVPASIPTLHFFHTSFFSNTFF